MIIKLINKNKMIPKQLILNPLKEQYEEKNFKTMKIILKQF